MIGRSNAAHYAQRNLVFSPPLARLGKLDCCFELGAPEIEWWRWPPLTATKKIVRRTRTSTTQDHLVMSPYSVLNVPMNSSYETVKAAFLKAALKHHPDHSKQADTAAFIRVRKAFEEIMYHTGSGNSINLKNNNSNGGDSSSTSDTTNSETLWKSDEEFQAWFRHATGEFLSFEMSHDTRQEVINVYRTMGFSPAGTDKGGYWEMARQLAEREDAAAARTTTTTSREKEPNAQRSQEIASSNPTTAAAVVHATALRRKRHR